MPALVVDQVSITMALLGGFMTLIGLATYILKERLYLSEPLIALVFGVVVGPSGFSWFRPDHWGESEGGYSEITFQIVRIVIGIQVLFAGIALPKAYLKKEWRSLAMLLLPVMSCAWFASALLIWALFPGLSFLESLVISSCVTPTDPVLANSITKGRFADRHVPAHVRNIIVAESGANDGLGFPFLFLPLYLILYKNPDYGELSTLGGAVGKWFYEIWTYQILLSVVEGAVIGYVARKTLFFAKQRLWIDHDSFLAYGVGLTFFTLGVVGLLGGDDLLCCFVVGNSFTWDDKFRLETEDEAFQDVIDNILNVGVFAYIGSVIPWSEMSNAEYGLTPWRFVVLGILVLLLRRPPFVVAFTRFTPVFQSYRESAFTAWFGPIGVSAVYYVEVALRTLPDDPALQRVRHSIAPIVYFCILSSVLIHGLSIPAMKLSTRTRVLTRTLSVRTRASSVASTVGTPDYGKSTVNLPGLEAPVDGQIEVPPSAVLQGESTTTIRFAEQSGMLERSKSEEMMLAVYDEGDRVVVEDADGEVVLSANNKAPSVKGAKAEQPSS